jgi:hypothetical protein
MVMYNQMGKNIELFLEEHGYALEQKKLQNPFEGQYVCLYARHEGI